MADVRRDGTPVTSPSPARGYSWPPAETGNVLAARHGAWSDRLVSERAKTVLADLVDQYPWLTEADAVTLDVLVRAKARFDLLDEYAVDVMTGARQAYPRKGLPSTGVEAVPDRVLTALARAETTILSAAGKLGLNAVDRAQLFKDAGMARHFGGDRIGQLVEKGRQVRENR